jgi:hypothetical protein
MKNIPNIEELKYLIPDFITGEISDADKTRIENALQVSTELRKFHREIKSTLEFAGKVKFEEPSSQYWTNLLPRIHQRIEEAEKKKFSWVKAASLWKVLVPIAAIILIALVYYMVQPSNTQLTKDEEKQNQNVVSDSSKDKNMSTDEIKQEVKSPEQEQDNIVSEQKIPGKDILIKKDKHFYTKDEISIVKEELPENRDNEKEQDLNNEDFASIELDDISIFTAGEAGGFDEEVENSLKKLDDDEQDALLRELENSNL